MIPSLLPAKGKQRYPSPESFFQRATSPLNTVYIGAANQTALLTQTKSVDRLEAFPFVLGVAVDIDALYFESTAIVANAVGRCGVYRNTSESILYPSSLIVESGEQAVATAVVRSAAVVARLAPGLYWTVTQFGTNTPTMRIRDRVANTPMMGIPGSLGAESYSVLAYSTVYAALPVSFPAGGTWNLPTAFSSVAVGLHFSA